MAVLSGIAEAGSKLASKASGAISSVGGKLSKAKTAISESKLGKSVSSLKNNVKSTIENFQSKQNQVNSRVNSVEKMLQGQTRNEVLKQETSKEQISLENRQLDILEQIERNTRDGLGAAKENKKQQKGIFGKIFDTLSTISNIRTVAGMLRGGGTAPGAAGAAKPGIISRTGTAIKNSRIGKAVSGTASAIANSKAGSAIGRAGSSIVKGVSSAGGAIASGASNIASSVANSSAGQAVSGAVKSGGGFLSKAFGAVSSAVSNLNPLNALKGLIGKNAGKVLGAIFTKIPGIGGLLTSALAAYNIASIKSDPTLSADEKKKQIGLAISNALGGIIGSIGGGVLAGTLGSVVPVAGTLAGGVLGSMAGGLVGTYVGEAIGGAIGPEKIYDLAAAVPGVGSLIEVTDTPKEQTPSATPTPKPPPSAADQLTPPGPPNAPQGITPEGKTITPETRDAKFAEPLASGPSGAALAGTALTGSIAAASMGALPSDISTTASIAPSTTAPTPAAQPVMKEQSLSERVFGNSMLGKIAQYSTPIGMMTSAYDFLNPPKEITPQETAKTPDQKKLDTISITANTVNLSGQISTEQKTTGVAATTPTTTTPTTNIPATSIPATNIPITNEAKKPEQKNQSLTEQVFGTGTFSKIAPFIPGANLAMLGTKMYDTASPVAEKVTSGAQSVLDNISGTLSSILQPKPVDQTANMSCIPLCDGSSAKPSPEWNSPKKNISEMLKEETMLSKVKDKVSSAPSGNMTNIISNNSTSMGGGGQNYVPNEPRMASAFPDPFFLSVNSELMNILRC